MIYPSRQVNAMKIGIRKSNSEKHVEVFSVALCSIIWKKIPSICGSKSLNAFTNKSCPNTKRIIENPNVQIYIFLEIFNLLAATRGFAKLFVQKVKSFWFVLWRTMKEDANARTTIIVTKLPGSALFIHLCCTGCGTRPRVDGTSTPFKSFYTRLVKKYIRFTQ